MKSNRAADRYANALAEAVQPPDTLEETIERLDALAELCREQPLLASTLTNPAHTAKVREAILADVLSALDTPETLRRFALVLFRRRRFGMLGVVADRFRHIANERLGRRTAHVTSVAALSPEDRERVRQSLSRYAGCEVQPTFGADPELIGGIVVQMNGTILDGSLRTSLRRLRETLLNEENGP